MPEHPRHILVATCLVRNAAGEILLVRHHQRGWELPQGRVEEGEALLPALHREVLEETGIRIENPRLVNIWSKVSEPTAVIFCFHAAHSNGLPTPSEETPEVDWFDEKRARDRITHPVNRDRLLALLQAPGSPVFRSYMTNPYRVLS